MHIEKNIYDNLLGTLLNLKGKSKDNLKARQDLQLMKIRSELHPILLPNGKYEIRNAPYTLSSNEKTRESNAKIRIRKWQIRFCITSLLYQGYLGCINHLEL